MDRAEHAPDVAQTREAAQTMITAAVAELTRLAIEPTLAPFTTKLKNNVNRWEEQVEGIHEIANGWPAQAQDLKTAQAELRTACAELQAAQAQLAGQLAAAAKHLTVLATASGAQADILEAARRRDAEFAGRLMQFQQQKQRQDWQLNRLDAECARLGQALRNARQACITGAAVLFVETLAVVLIVLFAR